MEQVSVQTGKSAEYNIYIQKNIFTNADHLKNVFGKYNNTLIITDDNVSKLHLDKVLSAVKPFAQNIFIFCLYPKESSKTIANAEKILYKLSENKFNKNDIILSLGGGMVSDIAGFCASIYRRGMCLAHIPTTLLAQTDAGIGGKTAVNTSRGKNMIGTIYHPDFVIIDAAFLDTLSEPQYFESFAEIIKYAVICDCELFEYLDNTPTADITQNIDFIIKRCIEHKTRVISADDEDKSDRIILNFGHTIAHVIEKYYNYEVYSHSKAVAIGIYNTVFLCESEGIVQPGLAERVKELLKKFNLPYKMPQIKKDDFYNILINDKKFCAGGLKAAVVTDIGSSKIIFISNEQIKILLDKYLKD